ncbi:MAG: Crp/Fnr family transcriptional regulator [Cyclobacteriaceae bacterium]
MREVIHATFPMSLASVRIIEDLVERVQVDKGMNFIEKGRHDNNEYFVLDGISRSYLLSPEGEKVTISFYTANMVLSPHTIRVQDGRSTLNFQALTPLELGVLDAKAFEQQMIENLEIREFGNTVLRNELKSKVTKEIGLASLTAKERLIAFRETYPGMENFVSHVDIASYLGITNISLSRLRKELM